ncbi:MAG TPA: PLP-dependent lyase/thiolase [Candidatus Acidoferrum sp.]|nr:PLP-dependent lyase/thiolase [Candidatus Acidoferrum sp.]
MLDILPVAALIGRTPCIELAQASAHYGCHVFGKIETRNPTGSHKDRENLEAIRDALAHGFDAVGCASTGNAAISLAALSRMIDLECHIYVSSGISREKLNLIRSFHPILHRISGAYEQAVHESNEKMRDANIYVANPGQCRAKIEGDKKIGMEIADKISPDVLVCPANNGTHLIGVWEGVKQKRLNPAIIAATAKRTAIADSISGFHRFEGLRWRNFLRISGTRVINVPDRQIRNAVNLLLQDGIIAEPAAATSLAALDHLQVKKRTIVCCTITGSGLKFPQLLGKLLKTST